MPSLLNIRYHCTQRQQHTCSHCVLTLQHTAVCANFSALFLYVLMLQLLSTEYWNTWIHANHSMLTNRPHAQIDQEQVWLHRYCLYVVPYTVTDTLIDLLGLANHSQITYISKSDGKNGPPHVSQNLSLCLFFTSDEVTYWLIDWLKFLDSIL